MQAKFIETWEADEDLSCSIYRKNDDSLTVWIKLGISIIEIHEESFDSLSEFLNFITNRIKEINSER